jgi:hypothetical protein
MFCLNCRAQIELRAEMEYKYYLRKKSSGVPKDMTKRLLYKEMHAFTYESRKTMLIILLLCSPVFLDFSCRSTQRRNNVSLMPVTRVVDGDTFRADDGTLNGLNVRLIGLDAPETRKSERKEIGYFGKESKYYLKQLLTGKKVRLEYDVAKYDQYGRTLAYVFLEQKDTHGMPGAIYDGQQRSLGRAPSQAAVLR